MKDPRKVLANELILAVQDIVAAETIRKAAEEGNTEEAEAEEDPIFAKKIRELRQNMTMLGRKKNKKLNVFGIEIIRPTARVEDLVDALLKIVTVA